MTPIVNMGRKDLKPLVTEADYEKAHAEATLAGMKAVEECTPKPMVVVDNNTGYEYPPIMDGACGFAWVLIKPATTKFARWLKSRGYFEPHYGGGIDMWISEYGQSYEKKLAFARGYADCLTNNYGVEAYGQGRLD